MNKINSQIDRLLQAASHAPDSTRELSYFTEEKIISQWKSNALQQPRMPWDTKLFGPALTIGTLVMSLSIFLSQILPKLDIMSDWGQTLSTFQQFCSL